VRNRIVTATNEVHANRGDPGGNVFGGGFDEGDVFAERRGSDVAGQRSNCAGEPNKRGDDGKQP